MSAAFRLYLWPHRLLVLAPPFSSAPHRHHAAQIAVGLDGTAKFGGADGKIRQADALAIAPDALHFHPVFGRSALLYLEAEGADWQRLRQETPGGLWPLEVSSAVRTHAQRAAAGDRSAAEAFVAGLLHAAAEPPSPPDPLVQQARALVARRLGGTIRLQSLAAELHRSPSRLAHRFRAATGVPLRRYVLWSRLRAAAEAAMRGATLTDAAHAAGFADSAHLSRTFRAMFGIAPSFLFERGVAQVTFCGWRGQR